MTVRLRGAGLTVRVGEGRTILDDASIEIHEGEIHALVGPNGAGKSTLFGVLSGDVAAQAGKVELDGRPIDRVKPRILAQQRAVLLQENTVTFPFSAEQVVRMGRTPWARTPASEDDDELVSAAMVQTEVTALKARAVPSLSGGERARVALARVIAQSTAILLLDEPTAALDLKHHEDVMRLIRGRADAGIAVAIVLHDLNAALAHADRVTLLADGRVAATGTAAEVLTAERIEQVYGQAVDVFPHPATGVPLVVARR
ncbi:MULTISPECIES: heme ABC transporter ATP-binding protein [unclassified Microbacterium]|uniref:heme ABC transporter ATP-binding protein n=1 Tax=unclassified Microbacterium TaxID=2609290 RepID=UPI000CFCB338|nr:MULTISPECIES: heme ABC transporter ATP-binding protein [unclassified Microbacterium]PQZ53894.1 heme ABC transporter ATP-binding protein [Microbacterium sp. MYb43]PQZ76767.1 heme ABC transporter ATP-binding protein [Microbacterium sp. MYb40]PRB21038.1 heme ABC transporter ATP-binding protein [Microbacterium sp. MYb54]PRB25044.1 heme ABC transporter ATP-binding protein [Microbacterium sp. MYb50]PRB66858.1 heme ABC transporter ATP-binding protein [Microbacterium sp. MYb24]